MPYITPEERKFVDKEINDLIEKMHKSTNEGHAAGLLNYVLTRIVLNFTYRMYNKTRYSIIATISGVLKNVSDEYYRRIAAPYEKYQIAKNGDLIEYETLTDIINHDYQVMKEKMNDNK